MILLNYGSMLQIQLKIFIHQWHPIYNQLRVKLWEFTWQTLFRVSDTGINVLFMFTFLSLLLSKLHISQPSDFIHLLPRNTMSAISFWEFVLGSIFHIITCYGYPPKPSLINAALLYRIIIFCESRCQR